MEGSDVQAPATGSRETYFAPAQRASKEQLAAQVAAVIDHPVIAAVLESFCGQVLVLNPERQILAASPEFKEALEACGVSDFVGRRPGEALGCEHSADGPGGCGTSITCSHCGVVMAILAAQCSGSAAYDECWIGMRRKDKRQSVEFRAKATPLVLDGVPLVVLALHDISDGKRRRILEQTFLHDARNVLGGIVTWSELMRHEPSQEAATSIRALALQLREHFAGHAVLAQAEKGEIAVVRAALDLPELARVLGETFSRHPGGEGKNFVVRLSPGAQPPISDQNLVLRVLSNMVANAIEASRAGATVQVHYEVKEDGPTFTVRNPGVISEDVAPRIFQRSFSTKTEPGHGLGTYSMRLLAEHYLGGRVGFTTSVEGGTAFTLTLPAM